MKFLILSCLCSISVFATEYQLRTQLTIDRAQIYLADVLQPGDYPSAVADTPLQRLAGNGPYTVNAARVYQVLRKAGLWQSDDRISGQCQVSRALETIEANDFEQVVRQDIQQRLTDVYTGAHVVIEQVQAAKAIQIIKDRNQAYELHAEPLQTGLAGRVPYRVKVMRGRFELGRVLCIMNVQLHYQAYVARRALRHGHVIAMHDLELIDIQANTLRELDYIQNSEDLIGKIVRRDLRQHTPLCDSMVREAYAVKGGQAVDLVYRHQEFTITMRGKAQGNASVGHQVRVRCFDGARYVNGTVIGPAQVLVE